VPSRGTAFPVRLLRVGRRATEHQHRAHQARAGARPERPKARTKQQEPCAPRARAALAQVSSLSLLPSVLALCLRLAAQHLAGGEQTHRWLFLSPSPLGTCNPVPCGSCFPPFVRFFSRFCSAVGVHRLLIVRCTARQCLVPFGGVRCLSKVPAQFPVWQVRISSPVFFLFHPWFARLCLDLSSIFCVGFPSIQGTYLSILVTSWHGYFRFGNFFWFACLAVIWKQRSNISREILRPGHRFRSFILLLI